MAMEMNDIYAMIIGRVLDITGNLLSTHLTRTNWDEYEKIIEQVYGSTKTGGSQTVKPDISRMVKTVDEIKEGVACLACSKNHISTVSAALNEAMRFARSDGVKHPEVIHRIGIALDELNIMERIDLASDKIYRLPEEDKEFANWILNQSRELRHLLDGVKTVEDLEYATAVASKFRDEYLNRIFDLTDVSKNKDKYMREICDSLIGEEKEKCMEAINSL